MKIISIILILFGVGIVGYGIGLNKSKNHALPMPKVIKRCTQSSPLKLEYGSKLINSLSRDEFWQMGNKVKISKGRQQGKEAIPVNWLFKYLGEGNYLEILPCSGNSFRLNYSFLQENPLRYLISQNKRGELKLVDMSSESNKPILKKIHLFRVHHSL